MAGLDAEFVFVEHHQHYRHVHAAFVWDRSAGIRTATLGSLRNASLRPRPAPHQRPRPAPRRHHATRRARLTRGQRVRPPPTAHQHRPTRACTAFSNPRPVPMKLRAIGTLSRTAGIPYRAAAKRRPYRPRPPTRGRGCGAAIAPMRDVRSGSSSGRGWSTRSSRCVFVVDGYWAVQPPSTGRIVPVTIAAASEMR